MPPLPTGSRRQAGRSFGDAKPSGVQEQLAQNPKTGKGKAAAFWFFSA